MSKKRECQYCAGRGFVQDSIFNKVPCKYCKGTGKLEVREKRKTIAIPVEVHRRLRDLAYEHKLSIVDFVKKVVVDYERKLDA